MYLRNAALATVLLASALLFTSAAPAAKSPPPAKAPTNLRITATTDSSVSLAWDAVTTGGNWWYCVQTSGSGCFRVDAPRTTITVPVWPGTTYTYTVITVSSSGQRSAPSNAVTYTAPPDTTPPTAPQLSTTSVVPTRVGLTWTQSVDNRTQVSYTLFVDGSAYSGPLLGFNGVTVPYLQPSSTHTFRVVARDYFGNSTDSNVVTVTTPPATEGVPPSAPTNLRLSPESSSPEIWLNWDAASDNFDPPGQLLYEVFVNGARASTGIGNVDDIVYCVDTGPNTVAVRAIDTSGNVGPFSSAIVFDC